MSGLLRTVGALSLAGGIVFALFTPAPMWVRFLYVLSASITALLWWALAEILNRLEAIQVMVGRPSR